MTPPSETTLHEIRTRLLAHYDRERRHLPWRDEPDPYRTWISEVMLQQTRVETVIPYYRRWIERFPTVADLAEADREEVLRAWAGLGYYARARNLHRAARLVRERHHGEIPESLDSLRELPGVGEYTAGAIASIAFGRPVPAVDANARRVIARLFDVEDPAPSRIRRLAATLVPGERAGDFNQAVMELGAMLCSPRSPDCPACPLVELCAAREHGTVAERPGHTPSAEVPSFNVGTAVLLSGTGRALLTRRPEDGMLGGLWEFPGGVVSEGGTPRAVAARLARDLVGEAHLPASPIRRIDRVPHAYSHRRHAYHAFLFRLECEPAARLDGSDPGWTEAVWAAPTEIQRRPLSTAQRKIAGAVVERLLR